MVAGLLFAVFPASLLGASPLPHFQALPMNNIAGFPASEPMVFDNQEIDARETAPVGFFHTTVTVISTSFIRLSSLHDSGSERVGGAFRVLYCHVSLAGSHFLSCESMVGGAIFLLSSQLDCADTVFATCTAYRAAGSISAAAARDSLSWSTFSLTIIGSEFRRCAALEFGGAMTIDHCNDILVDNTLYYGCLSGLTGGALVIRRSNCLMFRSLFAECTAGGKGALGVAGLDIRVADLARHRRVASRSLRGGGAICFSSDGADVNALTLQMTGGDGVVFDFGTDHCCFMANRIAADRLTDADRGFDIFLSGSVNFQSYGDRFLNSRNHAVEASTNTTRILIFGTRFPGDSRFLGDFPDCRVINESEKRWQDYYNRYEVPEIDAFDPPTFTFKEVVISPTIIDDGSVEVSATGVVATVMGVRTAADSRSIRVVTPMETVREDHVDVGGRLPSFGEIRPAIKGWHFRLYDLVSTAYDKGDVYERRYFRCQVNVIGCSFARFAIAGASIGSGGGGALAVRETQLLAASSNFTQCFASLGGAVVGVDSDVVVRTCRFFLCGSFSQGGALALQIGSNIDLNSWATDNVVHIGQSTFLNCTAREVGGALALYGILDASVDDSNFTFCHCGTAGGAIDSIDTELLIFRSHFINNVAGVRSTAFDVHMKPVAPVHRHGGAISFSIIEAPIAGPGGRHNVMYGHSLGTEDSCFFGNVVCRDGTTDSSVGSFDIAVEGPVSYQSWNDRFLNFKNMSIGLDQDYDAQLTSWLSYWFVSVNDSTGFLSFGHPCTVHHRAAFFEFTLNNTGIVPSLIDYEDLVNISDSFPPEDDWQDSIIATPGRSRPPPVLPFPSPSPCTMGTNLSIGIFFIHNPGTPSDTFSASPKFDATGNFSGSDPFPPTDGIVHSPVYRSANLPSSATLGDTPTFTGSSRLTLSSVFSPSRAIGESSIAVSAAFGSSIVNVSPAGAPSFLAKGSLTIGRSWAVAASRPFSASAQDVSLVGASGYLVESVGPGLLESSSFPASSGFAREFRDMGRSNPFTKTVVVHGDSAAFAVSGPSPSSTLTGNTDFVGSPSFRASLTFERPRVLVASRVFSGSRTFTPAATSAEPPGATFMALPTGSDLPADRSYSASVTVSMSVTLSTIIQTSTVMFGTTFVSSFTELVLITHVWSSETMSRMWTVTVSLIGSLTEAWIATFVDIPIYYSSGVASAVDVIVMILPAEANDNRLSDALVIGIASGAAVILALLIGGVIFLIKRRHVATATPESSLGGAMAEADLTKAASPDLGNYQGYEDGDATIDPKRFDLQHLETLEGEFGDDDVAEAPGDGFVLDGRAMYL